jgi:hypothetical protein
MKRQELEGALNLTDWTKVYDIKDVDAVLEYITAGIVLSGCYVPNVQKFFLKFANAKKAAKTIKGHNKTEAQG